MRTIRLVSVLIVLALTLATVAPAMAQSGGTIYWAGQGSDVLPCANGGHWVLAPSFGIESATLTVLGTSYAMAQSGQGSWSADSVGALPANLLHTDAYVTFTGPGDSRNHLQLSHCTGTPNTPTPTATTPATATATATPPGEQFAFVSVSLGACVWNGEQSLTPVTIQLDHASLTINGYLVTQSGTLNLQPGEYDWVATPDAGYSFPQGMVSSGHLTAGTCSPTTTPTVTPNPTDTPTATATPPGQLFANASVSLGACAWNGEQSLTPITVNLDHASLTINGYLVTQSGTLNLQPGGYDWVATADQGYLFPAGMVTSGHLVAGTCVPTTATATPGTTPTSTPFGGTATPTKTAGCVDLKIRTYAEMDGRPWGGVTMNWSANGSYWWSGTTFPDGWTDWVNTGGKTVDALISFSPTTWDGRQVTLVRVEGLPTAGTPCGTDVRVYFKSAAGATATPQSGQPTGYGGGDDGGLGGWLSLAGMVLLPLAFGVWAIRRRQAA